MRPILCFRIWDIEKWVVCTASGVQYGNAHCSSFTNHCAKPFVDLLIAGKPISGFHCPFIGVYFDHWLDGQAPVFFIGIYARHVQFCVTWHTIFPGWSYISKTYY